MEAVVDMMQLAGYKRRDMARTLDLQGRQKELAVGRNEESQPATYILSASSLENMLRDMPR